MSKNLWEIPDHESAARSMDLDRQMSQFSERAMGNCENYILVTWN